LIIDTGTLGGWSHQALPPTQSIVQLSAVLRGPASWFDFAITGTDALVAGKAIGDQWPPDALYDVPANDVPALRARFDALLKAEGLDARLQTHPNQVPHRQRVDQVLRAGNGAGEVRYSGGIAVAVAGLPRDASLPVVGLRMSGAEFADYWQWICLDVQPGAEIARSEQVGTVLVDCARLMFVDVDSLAAWQHDEPLDGKADVAFWGRDARVLADATDAPAYDYEYGWRDLPIDEALRLFTVLLEARAALSAVVATDFRPHSHHYYVMEQIRSTPNMSGTLDVGGARLCAFHTGCGDGYFPILCDLDRNGRLVRLRIDLQLE
jgi:hypothetical protein